MSSIMNTYYTNEIVVDGRSEKNIIQIVDPTPNRHNQYFTATAWIVNGELRLRHYHYWLEEFLTRPATEEEIRLFHQYEGQKS